MSINRVTLLGRLGGDPELKYTPNGQAVCNFSLATSESWTDKNNGQKQERTEWHRIVVWGKLGELCNQYLEKGRQALVEGKIATRSWETEDGSKRYSTEIIASNIQFLGSPSQQTGQPQQAPGTSTPRPQFQPSGQQNFQQNYQAPQTSNYTADDIPF